MIKKISSIREKLNNFKNNIDIDRIGNQNKSDFIFDFSYLDENEDMHVYSVSLVNVIDDAGEWDDVYIDEQYINDVEEVKNRMESTISINDEVEEFVDKLVQNIDSNFIFNQIFIEAKRDYIRNRIPLIYQELNNIKMERKERVPGVNSIGVCYDKKIRKYKMLYNTDFYIKSVLKEYLYRSNMYLDLKSVFIYVMMFLMCHEVMHILRNHIRVKNNYILKELNNRIINQFGDAFINMNLARRLNNNSLVNDYVIPFVGVSNENIYRGSFKEDMKGESFRKIYNNIYKNFNKYTSVDIQQRQVSKNKNIPIEFDNSIFKVIHPQKAVSNIFYDNSNVFIRCMGEIIESILENVKKITKEDLNIGVGTPVRVKKTGKRGVIVEDLGNDMYKVAESSKKEDIKVVSDYMQGNSVNILGDYHEDELKILVQAKFSDDNSDGEGVELGEDIEPEFDDKPDKKDDNEDNKENNEEQKDLDGNENNKEKDKNEGREEEGENQQRESSNKEGDKMDELERHIQENMLDENDEKEISDEVREEMLDNMSDRTKNKIKKQIQKQISNSVNNIEELSQEDFKMIQNSDLGGRLNVSTIADNQWRLHLYELLQRSLGLKEEYNPHKPSRRVEDAFGTPVVEKDLKNIVLAMDYSGSMGAPKFKQSLRHTETFLRNLDSNPDFTIIFWGGDPRDNEFMMNKVGSAEEVRQVLSEKGEGRWGTNFRYCVQYLDNNLWEIPDSIIVFTDGEFTDGNPSEKEKMFVKDNYKRFLWVLTSDGTLRNIKRYDEGVEVEGRYIKQE